MVREGQKLFGTVNSLSTLRDDWLRVEALLPELVVVDAYLETARSGGGEHCSTGIEGLKGMTVGFSTLPQAVKVALPVGSVQEGYYRRMLSEGLISLLQAEAFFYRERGFSSAADYDNYWKDFSRGSCRYYSNLERVSREFMQYIIDQERKLHLFSRQRHARVEQSGPATITAEASMRDSYHEMHIRWEIDSGSLAIRAAWGKIARAPDLVCRETELLFEGLPGKTVSTACRREIRDVVDGPQGCNHFGDLVIDLIWAVDAFCSA